MMPWISPLFRMTRRALSILRSFGSECGAALVLSAVGLAGITGLVALSVDVGHLLQERRHIQNAVDAAALAGALNLPADPAAATAYARRWAGR